MEYFRKANNYQKTDRIYGGLGLPRIQKCMGIPGSYFLRHLCGQSFINIFEIIELEYIVSRNTSSLSHIPTNFGVFWSLYQCISVKLLLYYLCRAYGTSNGLCMYTLEPFWGNRKTTREETVGAYGFVEYSPLAGIPQTYCTVFVSVTSTPRWIQMQYSYSYFQHINICSIAMSYAYAQWSILYACVRLSIFSGESRSFSSVSTPSSRCTARKFSLSYIIRWQLYWWG